MPYHSNSVDKMKEKIDKKKEEKEKKPRKKTQKELFEKKELTKAQMEQLKKHSKLHKGGMNSFHIKNMIKFMKQGNSFMKAHMKAQQLDKAKK
jgi:hypothetical protein